MEKILIIEDDYDTAKVLEKRITVEGYEVILAYDSYSGAAVARKELPDLILLDLMLPAGGGESVLGNIRMGEATKRIPVIILTGITDESVRKNVEKMKISAYVAKPYEPKKLLGVIRDVLSNRGN